jgi:branched-chain amino acid transport system permease protein
VETFGQHLLNGLVIGSVYALIALGVTLVFGLTRLINFAHGEVVTIGAFVTFFLVERGNPYFMALPLVILVGGGIGFALERGAFRFTRSAPIGGFILSLGLIAISQGVLFQFTEGRPRSITPPLTGVVKIGEIAITQQRLFVMAVSAVLVAAMFFFLRFTRLGRGTRAYAEDPDAASMMGVRSDQLVVGMFIIGSALAAGAGGLLVSLFSASDGLGSSFIVKAFAVALIGGLGSAEGALVAALGVGMAETLGAAYISSAWTDAFGYLVMLIVLMISPTGISRGASGAEL